MFIPNTLLQQWPEISAPENLRQDADRLCKKYFPHDKQNNIGQQLESNELPRPNWPQSVRVLHPHRVFIHPDHVDLMLSSGGINYGSGYGYTIESQETEHPGDGITKYGATPEIDRHNILIFIAIESFLIALCIGMSILFIRVGRTNPNEA